MPQRARSHRYAQRQAFERLMLLLATLVHEPGVGSADTDATSSDRHHDALEAVRARLLQRARAWHVELPHCSPATLRKDLETLRHYGILERRMYRWGYYLGTGAIRYDELPVILDALASQAQSLGEPQARQLYHRLRKRLHRLDAERNGRLFYPVRQQLDHAIVYTDSEQMWAAGEYQSNLFHRWDELTDAIGAGSAIELSRASDPYAQGQVGRMRLFPLQLIYREVAWYLIYETDPPGHLAVARVDRFYNYLRWLGKQRDRDEQARRLRQAHQLLQQGWGLFLGPPEQQQAELQGQLSFETVTVRFFPPAIAFLQEGKRRHSTQRLRTHKDRATGKVRHLDYTVRLPPRSLPEFSLWVHSFMDKACVQQPEHLVQAHAQAARALAAHYRDVSAKANND